MRTDYEFCILKSDEEFIEYEKGLFASYALNDIDFIKRNNHSFEILNNNRVRSKILYEDQIVYAARSEEQLIYSMAIHINNKNIFQLEKLGYFFNDGEKDNKICEGINFFKYNNRQNINSFAYILRFAKDVLNDLKQKGFLHFYGSCQNEMFRMYDIIGFKQISSINLVDGKKEIIIKYSF